MKYIVLILSILTISTPAISQSPWYFGSGEAVNLTNGTAFKNGVKNIAGSLDPSVTAVSAPSGSMYFSTSGTIYVKQDAGLTTNWLPLGIATTGSLTTINGQSGPNVNIATGSSGTDFNIAAGSNTITLNLPTASASNRGLLSTSDWSMFNGKQDAITGAASTVTTSNLTANRAVVSNGSGKIAASSVTDTELGYVSGVTSAIQTQIDSKEPAIAAGTTGQYWRGDKSWQTLDKAAVGLSNVDNTSDANKPVSTATQTALDAKVAGPASSVDGEIALFNSTTGKIIKRATGTGFVKATSGVYSTASSVDLAADVGSSVLPMANGGTDKALVSTLGGVVYTDANSMEVLAPGTSGQILQSNGAAAPTFVNKSISGKAQNKTAVTVEEIQSPNNLLTPTASGKYLHESGNKNILDNPSFENTTYSTSWNIGSGSPSSEMVTVIDGKQALFVTYSAAAASVVQDSTLYQAQFADGVQGLAMVRVKTTVSGIKVCPRQAATTSTNCVDVNNNGKWGLYKVPFILGATSNGIFIGSTSNVTGDVYIDDAFVGAVDLKQDYQACRSIDCETTFTAFSTGGTISAENYDFLNGSGSYSGGVYTFNFNSNIFTVAPSCIAMGVNGGAGSVVRATSIGTTGFAIYNTNDTGSTASTGNMTITCTRAGQDFIDARNKSYGQVYSSTNADTDWASCGHTTSDFTGFGTVTNIETQCKRDGGDLLMKGKFTSGATTAVEARLALKLNGLALTSYGVSKIPSLQYAGDLVQAFSAAGYARNSVLIEPSVGYVTFGYQSASINAATKATGAGGFNSGTVQSFFARIPISGWDNSNVIIGTFSEVMVTPGVTKPESFSATFGTTSSTVCSANPCAYLDQVGSSVSSVSRSSTGAYTINLAKTYTKLKCTASIGASAPAINNGTIACSNCASFSMDTRLASTSAAVDSLVTFDCKGYAP